MMEDTTNNNSIGEVVLNINVTIDTTDKEILTKLSESILTAYRKIAVERIAGDSRTYDLWVKPISGIGENSYGLIMQVCVRECVNATETNNYCDHHREIITILKISPKNPSFRAHSRIADLYKREVFMYETIFKEFRQLSKDLRNDDVQQNGNSGKCQFDNVPELLHTCLDDNDEFIILEDLSQWGYEQNLRTNMPTFELAAATFRSIAKFHAMSFILQAKKPKIFQNLLQPMSDNLFTDNVDPITIEFGKKHIRKTRLMLQQDSYSNPSVAKQIESLQILEDNFKRMCLQCVNGTEISPYAVICHGDFWNNNMMYTKKPSEQETIDAKLIDFQLSRYASPILDLVHYLYTSTDRELRSKHFPELLDIYYNTLTAHIQYYGLNIEDVYPKGIFLQQIKEFGIFGFCMAAFSIPFFISDSTELPDLDEVATAIREISSSEGSEEEKDEEIGNDVVCNDDGLDRAKYDANAKRMELLDEYDLLTERTLPIFKRRMCDIVDDLDKNDMLNILFKLS
ncbi:uncharacterized protein LOC142234671 [Haematobia irritans]|uniref:uncharacterized protein LOC142234671 n=1 Tax=Haematobia irritans TaxID=7368 RepID=UPI003F4F9ADD